MKDYRFFFFSFATAFALTLFLANRSFCFFQPQLYEKMRYFDLFDRQLVGRLPSALIRRDVRNPTDAKNRRLFWASLGTRSEGVAVDLLRDKKIQKVFPGYLNLTKDQPAWNRYFRKEFDADSWMEDLSGGTTFGVKVSISWAGCIDIYRDFGADILIFGSSEVYRGIVPAELSSLLRKALKLKEDPRVLFCSTSGMPIESVLLTVDKLRKVNRQKAKMILFGYGAGGGFQNPSMSAIQDDRTLIESKKFQLEKAEVQPRNVLPLFFISDDLQDRGLGWDDLLKVGFQKLREIQMHNREESISYVFSAVDDIEIKMNLLVKAKHSSVERFCNTNAEDLLLADILSSFSQLAESTLIYVPPATPVWRKNDSPCTTLSKVTELLNRHTSDSVRVFTEDWRAYGLLYNDFLYPWANSWDQRDDRVRVDLHHTNLPGALKVTRKIAELMAPMWVR